MLRRRYVGSRSLSRHQVERRRIEAVWLNASCTKVSNVRMLSNTMFAALRGKRISGDQAKTIANEMPKVVPKELTCRSNQRKPCGIQTVTTTMSAKSAAQTHLRNEPKCMRLKLNEESPQANHARLSLHSGAEIRPAVIT